MANYYKIFLDEGVEYIKVRNISDFRVYVSDYGDEYYIKIDEKQEKSIEDLHSRNKEKSNKEEFNKAVGRIITICNGVIK